MAAPTTAPPWRTPWTKAWRSEGRPLVVEDDVVAAVLSHLGDHERRRALLEALRHGLRDVERHEGVEPAGLEGGQARAALPDDGVANAVEVGTAGHEVVGIPLELDHLPSLVLLEPERSRAHAALAQLGEGDVGRIHGGVAGGEHEEEGGLGPLEPEHDGMRLRRLDGLDIGIPVLAGAQAKLGGRLRRLPDHVEGVLDVARGEGLAVMPAHVLLEEEDEVAKVVLPRPPLGQLGDDRVHALERLQGMEEHDVRVARRHGPHVRDGGRLVNQQARRVLREKRVEDAAALGRLPGSGKAHGHDGEPEHEQAHGQRSERTACHG